MGTNKDLEWYAEGEAQNPSRNNQYMLVGYQNILLKAPTIEQAKAKALVEFKKQVKEVNKKLPKNEQYKNPRIREVEVSFDSLNNIPNQADKKKEFDRIVQQVTKNNPRNYIVKISNASEEISQIDGIRGTPSFFLNRALKDKLPTSIIDEYIETVLNKCFLNNSRLKVTTKNQKLNQEQKKADDIYAKSRHLFSTKNQGRLDAVHKYKTPNLLQGESAVDKSKVVYARKQKVAFEDGGVIGGFNYSIGGL